MFEITEEIEFTQEDINLYNGMLRTTRENILHTEEQIEGLGLHIQDITELSPYITRIHTELYQLKHILQEYVGNYSQWKKCIGNVIFHLGEVEREMIRLDYEITELFIDDENKLDALHTDIMKCKEGLNYSIAGLLL